MRAFRGTHPTPEAAPPTLRATGHMSIGDLRPEPVKCSAALSGIAHSDERALRDRRVVPPGGADLLEIPVGSFAVFWHSR